MGTLLIQEKSNYSFEDKRRDKFDQVVTEYKRRNRNRSMEQVCKELGCDPATLWRYRKNTESFTKAPFVLICKMLVMAKVTRETFDYIAGIK